MTDARRFVYRAGVRVTGTTIACDPLRSASEVVFLSHAPFPGDRQVTKLLAARNAVSQMVSTNITRQLLGRLDVSVLECEYGRPFALGDLRLEVVPSGFTPGAAALMCRLGESAVLYTGPVRLGDPAPGARETEIRPAEAVCIDATFGAPHFAFPPRAESLAAVVAFARTTLAGGGTPVLLLDEFDLVPEVAAALAAAEVGAQAHASFVGHVRGLQDAGVDVPALKRVTRTPEGAAVLWPVHLRAGAAVARLTDPRMAFVSGFAADAGARARVGAAEAIVLSGRADHKTLVSYVRATGAREVATVRGHAEALATSLRDTGLDAYSLGPPQQIPLFDATAEDPA